MRKMKTLITMILCVGMVLFTVTAGANGVAAPLKMRLSTRSGPGTQYDEPGTFYQSAWKTTCVDVLSKSWDNRNDIWWVLVDFTYTNGTKYRVWTGLKRVDVNLDYVPEFNSLDWHGYTMHDYTGYYGPGSNYAKFGTVPDDHDFVVLAEENNYLEVTYMGHDGSGVHRCWIYNDGSLNLTEDGCGPMPGQ